MLWLILNRGGFLDFDHATNGVAAADCGEHVMWLWEPQSIDVYTA